MCGITGILNFNGKPVDNAIISQMNDVIAHRGPDGAGQWVDGCIALGHRRLAIIDLSSKGSQPMCNDDGSVIITLNGEIYNYHELVPDIKNRGYNLFSSSDTEVVLRLYEIYGKECLGKLRGMFAFAIWDKKKQLLLIARDRVGIKPLYYFVDKKHFVFASEIKAILASGYTERYINKRAFAQYMRFLTVPQPDTIFENIFKLEPGCFMTVNLKGQVRKKSFWNLSDHFCVEQSENENDYKDKLEELLSESIRYHMVADVPVAAFLSGGLDSSAVVAMMRKNYPEKPISSFSIVFPDLIEFDEGRYANMVSEEMQTSHHAYPFDQYFLKDFDKIVWHLDEPFAVSSAFATFYLAKNTSRHVKVVLTGDGGDELFAGYKGYENDHYLRYPEYCFSFITQLCSALHFTLKYSHFKNKFALRLLTGLSRRAGDEGVRYSEQIAQNGLYGISMAFNQDCFFNILENWTDNLTAYFYNNIDVEDRLLRKLYSSYMTRLVDEMLMKVDRMTMAHSLEARVPLLDHKIVEFAFSLPSQMKLKNKGSTLIGKYIFKKVMDKYLPEGIIYRDKKGFNIPVGNWLNGPFKNDIIDQIKHGYLMKHGILNPKGIEAITQENKTTMYSHTNMLMSLFSFEKWMNVYQNKFGQIVFH